ncbi:MAG: cytochrome c [Niastella sp.]|nr:cytochrome c [Niastella sp.]
MKKLIIIGIVGLISIIMYSCGGGNSNSGTPVPGEKTANGNPSYDPNRGEGKFKKVEVGATIDAAMAENGNKVFSVKCGSCHKLSEEKLVGPGWKGVTSRNTAEWIMNFITNTDEMLSKDPKAQAQLEICLVRMPNQNLTDDDARALYEFMRKNDDSK